ncbi:MAG: hypothetical protein KJS98_20830 [Nitrospirae bacterium]|nr:hypothetical protein [Nitrospirota bacterium]
MNTSTATADARLTRGGREWRDKRDRQGPGIRVTQVALFARSKPVRDEPS